MQCLCMIGLPRKFQQEIVEKKMVSSLCACVFFSPWSCGLFEKCQKLYQVPGSNQAAGERRKCEDLCVPNCGFRSTELFRARTEQDYPHPLGAAAALVAQE